MSILAGTSTDAYTPPELFAGDAPIITNARTVEANVVLDANSVLARNPAGNLVEWVPGAADSTATAVAVSCEAIDTTGAASKQPVYEGAFFNTDALNWPTGATEAQIDGAFVGTDIHHRSLGYSG